MARRSTAATRLSAHRRGPCIALAGSRRHPAGNRCAQRDAPAETPPMAATAAAAHPPSRRRRAARGAAPHRVGGGPAGRSMPSYRNWLPSSPRQCPQQRRSSPTSPTKRAGNCEPWPPGSTGGRCRTSRTRSRAPAKQRAGEEPSADIAAACRPRSTQPAIFRRGAAGIRRGPSIDAPTPRARRTGRCMDREPSPAATRPTPR